MSITNPGFHSIFGPSGVGKSSLARILSGLVPIESGKVININNCVILYSHNQERLPDWSHIGQHLDRVTPEHNLQLQGRLIDDFGVRAFVKHRFSQLSLGQQNRVNLIRYLVQDFDILILDESLANVDEKTRQQIIIQTKRIFPDRIFLYISHHVVEVATFCKEIWVLRDTTKQPQVSRGHGLDLLSGKVPDQAALKKAMLEIINLA
jgi:ABC-type nitrate/sulfonate/bicarbonate transport system ATPase subunit